MVSLNYSDGYTNNFFYNKDHAYRDLVARSVYFYNKDLDKLKDYLSNVRNVYMNDSEFIEEYAERTKNISRKEKTVLRQTRDTKTEEIELLKLNKNIIRKEDIVNDTFSGTKRDTNIEADRTKFKSRSSSSSGFGKNPKRCRIKKTTGNNLGSFNPEIIRTGKRAKVKNKFKRSSAYGLPVSYSNLSSHFDLSGSDGLPVFTSLPTRTEVASRDEEAIKAFTSCSLQLSRDMQYLACRSTLWSFLLLGCAGTNTWSLNTRRKFKPYSISKSVKTLAKDTNSGFPLFGRKNDPKVMKETKHWLEQYLSKPTKYNMRRQFIKNSIVNSTINNGSLVDQPVYIMHRFQVSPVEKFSREFDVKIRPVWCIPYNIVSLENMFFGTMIENMKLHSEREENPIFPIGYTNKQLSQRIALPLQRRIRRSIDRKARSFDFSKFDASIHTIFTSAIFTIWGDHLELSASRAKAYNALRFYTCYTPFVHDNEIHVTRKGVCSGSFTTNARDTIVNLAMIIMAYRIKYDDKIADAIINNYILELDHLNCGFAREDKLFLYPNNITTAHLYGDDGIVLEDDKFFIIHKFICGEFGMTISYEEPVSSNGSFYFLGRFWDKDGLPWQTDYYMKAHIMFRSRWYKKESLSFNISEYLDLYRVLSICLPLRDGRSFLDKYFRDWPPYVDFISGRKGYYLLKEWPHDKYEYISRDDAFNIFRY